MQTLPRTSQQRVTQARWLRPVRARSHCLAKRTTSPNRTRTTSGSKPVITETQNEGTVAGSYIREMLESGVDTAPSPLWIGYDEDAQRGFREAPLQFESLFRHIWITGTTGYGKTTELLNMMVQWAYSGYGFVYFDPKGRDSQELLRMLPEDRLDDVVWIEPGSSEHDKTVGLNFLEVPDCETEEERENGSRIASRTSKRSSIRTSTGGSTWSRSPSRWAGQ